MWLKIKPSHYVVKYEFISSRQWKCVEDKRCAIRRWRCNTFIHFILMFNYFFLLFFFLKATLGGVNNPQRFKRRHSLSTAATERQHRPQENNRNPPSSVGFQTEILELELCSPECSINTTQTRRQSGFDLQPPRPPPPKKEQEWLHSSGSWDASGIILYLCKIITSNLFAVRQVH